MNKATKVFAPEKRESFTRSHLKNKLKIIIFKLSKCIIFLIHKIVIIHNFNCKESVLKFKNPKLMEYFQENRTNIKVYLIFGTLRK